MKQGRFVWLAALAVPLCVGCADSRVRIELLEQENRWQEDEINYLQGCLNEYDQRLDSCRRENASLKKDLGVTDGKSYNPRKDLPDFHRGGGSKKGNGVPTLPMVEPGEPTDPRDLTKPTSRESTDWNSNALPRIMPVSTSIMAAKEEDLPADQVIDKIVLNKRLTGGHNSDGRPGDDGIMVVFQPKNAAGQYVPIAGETSIVLMDPNLDGEASRIARWDFATDEVVTHFQKTFLGKALNFELRWPDHPPENRKLRLYVRYITAEGKRLIADQEIHLHFASDDHADRSTKAEESGTDESCPAIENGPVARPDKLTPRTASPKWQPFR